MCGEAHWSVSNDIPRVCLIVTHLSTAFVYGIATSHPAFSSFTDTLGFAPGTIVLSPLGAKALGAVILTFLFGLRVFYTQWSSEVVPKSRQKKEKTW